MTLYLAISFCALFVCPSSGLQQDVFSVPIQTKSGADTPLQVSGKLTLQESARGNELEWSWGEKVAITNVTGKAILLFVATIAEIGRHPAPAGRHAALGDGPTYQLEDDRFFNEKLIEPGESLVLRDTKPGAPDVACCINPLAETHDPSAEYRVQFVQFADGSVFGDPAEARGSLAIRQTILRGLRELLQSYEHDGESGFVARLKDLRSYLTNPNLAPKVEDHPPFFATAVCRQIVARYDSDGTLAALGQAKKVLNVAEKHAAMIALRPPSQ
jgi:hypothetical protein